jgi:hypothetical protein
LEPHAQYKIIIFSLSKWNNSFILAILWVVVYGFYVFQLMKRFKWIHCKSGNTRGNLNLLLIRVWVRKERLHLACVFQRKSLEKYRKSSSPAVHCLHCLESVVFTQSHCIQIALSLTFSLSLSLFFFFGIPGGHEYLSPNYNVGRISLMLPIVLVVKENCCVKDTGSWDILPSHLPLWHSQRECEWLTVVSIE